MGGDCQANIIGRFDELVIAEIPIIDTPLVGKSLAERTNWGERNLSKNYVFCYISISFSIIKKVSISISFV
jgi:hypothetical protein